MRNWGVLSTRKPSRLLPKHRYRCFDRGTYQITEFSGALTILKIVSLRAAPIQLRASASPNTWFREQMVALAESSPRGQHLELLLLGGWSISELTAPGLPGAGSFGRSCEICLPRTALLCTRASRSFTRPPPTLPFYHTKVTEVAPWSSCPRVFGQAVQTP